VFAGEDGSETKSCWEVFHTEADPDIFMNKTASNKRAEKLHRQQLAAQHIHHDDNGGVCGGQEDTEDIDTEDEVVVKTKSGGLVKAAASVAVDTQSVAEESDAAKAEAEAEAVTFSWESKDKKKRPRGDKDLVNNK
jgi:hypothetical protein